jgi:hypothetical protein
LSIDKSALGSVSNSTNDRAVAAGGGRTGTPYINVMEYVNITSIGNSNYFGDLTAARTHPKGASNGINERGVFGGGTTITAYVNTMDYITINSAGNAQGFGDLTVARTEASATDNG